MTLTVEHELERAAAERPDHVFLRMRAGELTYAQMWQRVCACADRLTEEGVRPGDPVVLLMANAPEQVVLWGALSRLGAVHVPLNTDLVGRTLEHALRTARPVVAIADDAHLDVLTAAAGPLGIAVQTVEWAMREPSAPGISHSVPRVTDDLATATLLFTSGTTGPSKACALSHRYLVRQGQVHVRVIGATPDDVLHSTFPLFHIDAATLTLIAALTARATAAIGVRFSASRYWQEVRDLGATVLNYMGATLTILWKADPSPRDRDHRVRLAWGVPMPEWRSGFEERFGIPLMTCYGLTDAGIPVYEEPGGERRPGTCGRAVPEFEVRIDSVPGAEPGVGEICVRGREPGLVMNGYFGNPDATAATIVDGWVRTGDLGALDADGFLTFHGRLTDSIRRRGENISAFEVEEMVCAHPDVVEAAALGVPSELTEEDLLVCVVARPGSGLTAEAVREHCRASGPRHMVPAHVWLVDELPKTPTQKVEKFRLRERWPAAGE